MTPKCSKSRETFPGGKVEASMGMSGRVRRLGKLRSSWIREQIWSMDVRSFGAIIPSSTTSFSYFSGKSADVGRDLPHKRFHLFMASISYMRLRITSSLIQENLEQQMVTRTVVTSF